MRNVYWPVVASVLVLLGAGPARAADPVNYGDTASWLCRPGQADPCAQTLTSTVIAGDGGQSKVSYPPDPSAPIDCFYVYPTVSHELSPNADMALEDAEKRAAENQFARFAAVCRPFAPLYRQVTLAGLEAVLTDAGGVDFELPYQDILAAWRWYLDHDNQGRGVVLIGHSQGSHVLLRLLREEIDGKPFQKQLISAILAGEGVDVPKDASVGGALKQIPLCGAIDETGCVISYSSYLASDPPGANAHFGSAETSGMVYGCVNPGALTGDGTLDPELPAVGRISRTFGTNFVGNPGLITAKCVIDGGHSYLAISVGDDVRSEPVLTALKYIDARRPGWGLHSIDINLALGNLVEIVGRQAKAWAAKKP